MLAADDLLTSDPKEELSDKAWSILEANCLKCHGPEKQKSSYRLDDTPTAMKGGDFGETAIVAFKADESSLIQYVSGTADPRMPPTDSGLSPLNDEQLQTLREWINQGAIFPEEVIARSNQLHKIDWWSWQPLTKPDIPSSNQRVGDKEFRTRDLTKNPIDSFILAKLDEKGLALSPKATPFTLIDRVYADLIGLPPSAEEVVSFTNDYAESSDIAYEKLVDRLLASPRYGERWARHWLDIVHYGDTHGYDKDKLRPNAWPYRDYVIRSFNEDKNYSQFIEEQIAGDILFPNQRDSYEALGLLSAGPWDFIGHAEVPESKTDGKIARHLDRDDMVGTVVGTLTSSTVQCAQCHNHKFDPVTQDDYYSMQSVFAAIDRADKSYDIDPQRMKQRSKLETLRSSCDALVRQLESEIEAITGPELKELDQKLALLKKPTSQKAAEFGWHSEISPIPDEIKWVQIDLGDSKKISRIVMHPTSDDFASIGDGFGFPVRFRIEVSNDISFAAGASETIYEASTQDLTNPGIKPQIYDGMDFHARFVRVTATRLAKRLNDYIFAFAELEIFDDAGKNIASGSMVTSLDSIEASPRWSRKNLVDSIYPGKGKPNDEAIELQRTALTEQKKKLLESKVDQRLRNRLKSAEQDRQAIAKQISDLPAPLRVYAGTIHQGSGAFAGTGSQNGKPRPISVLARGNVNQPIRSVTPGAMLAIEKLTELPSRFSISPEQIDNEGLRRAALARWISERRNPLTWRSIVNRVWQYHFGKGIVETSNDFGRMGSLPTHPELLDWLAVEFRDDMHGSMKHLHRLIVTSQTYRQSSDGLNEKASSIDFDNSLLWRQNRRKLEAEVVRDSILSVAGTLDTNSYSVDFTGGPGWQDFVIEHPEHSPHFRYDLADPHDPKLWRRSIYRFIVRSQTQPLLTMLDCADPSIRVEKRNQTISPLQSLTMLNNAFIIVQSKRFAERVTKELEIPDSESLQAEQIERIVHLVYRTAFHRLPEITEKQLATEYIQHHGLPNFCRLIFNLNEFHFVD